MGEAVDLSVCRGCYCLAARRLAREITRTFERGLRRHGLRATQFSVLAALALQGPTPVVALAEALGLERTTLTRIGAVLERRGWVGSAPSSDARRHIFRLTGAGRRKLEEAFPAWSEAQNFVRRRLGGTTRYLRLAGRTGRGSPTSGAKSRVGGRPGPQAYAAPVRSSQGRPSTGSQRVDFRDAQATNPT